MRLIIQSAQPGLRYATASTRRWSDEKNCSNRRGTENQYQVGTVAPWQRWQADKWIRQSKSLREAERIIEELIKKSSAPTPFQESLACIRKSIRICEKSESK